MAFPTSRLLPQDTKRYQFKAPPSTHYRPATCAEVDCPWYLDGFQVRLDEATADGAARAAYLRADGVRDGTAGLRPQGSDVRYYRETREGGVTVFTYPPGTRGMGCQHRIRLERPEIYIVRSGLAKPRIHTSAEHWVEDFANHQQMLHDLHQEG